MEVVVVGMMVVVAKGWLVVLIVAYFVCFVLMQQVPDQPPDPMMVITRPTSHQTVSTNTDGCWFGHVIEPSIHNLHRE